MKKKENETDLCCACGSELPGDPDQFVNFRYQVPGDGLPEQILVAATCDKCAKEAEDPNTFPVVELLINARIIRIEHPERSFKP